MLVHYLVTFETIHFILRVLFSPPSPTSELRNRQLCGVVVNRLQMMNLILERMPNSGQVVLLA